MCNVLSCNRLHFHLPNLCYQRSRFCLLRKEKDQVQKAEKTFVVQLAYWTDSYQENNLKKNQCFCTHALNCMHLLHTRTCTHLVTQNFFFLPSYHYLFHLARKRTLCSFYICSDINTTCISLQSLIFCLIITCNNNRYWFSQCLLVG